MTTAAPTAMSVHPLTMSLFAGMTGMDTSNPQLVETPSISEFGDGNGENDMDEDNDEDDEDEDEEMAPPSKSSKKKKETTTATDKQRQQKITPIINPRQSRQTKGDRSYFQKLSSSSATSSSSCLLSATSTSASSVFSTGGGETNRQTECVRTKAIDGEEG
jgi:hypothetical protein